MGSVAVRIAASLAFEARNTTAARRLGMRIWLTSLSTKVMTSRVAARRSASSYLDGARLGCVCAYMSGRHSSECRYTSQAAALGGNVASVNGALARMGSPAGSASGRSAALSAHTKPPP